MALDLRMLFQMRQHYDERNSFLVNHTPKILYRRFQRALCRDKQLIIPRNAGVNEVGIYVRVANVLVPLDQSHTGMLDY